MKKAVILMIFLLFSAGLAWAGEEKSLFERQGAVIPNLTLVKKEIRHYHDSGAWDREIDILAERGMELLKRYDTGSEKKYAIVLDIDETCISSYQFLDEVDFAFKFDMSQWQEWLKKVNTATIRGTLRLFRFAKDRGFKILFVTGRLEENRKSTEESLTKAGFSGYDRLVMYNGGYKDFSASTYKAAMRKRLTEEGYVIVLNVGDQESDLAGGYSEHVIKLPNPMYFIP